MEVRVRVSILGSESSAESYCRLVIMVWWLWMTDSSSIVSMCREWCCDFRIRQIELHVYAFVRIGV